MVDIVTEDTKARIHIEEDVVPNASEFADDSKLAFQHTESPVAFTTEEERRLYRKIDLRLIPVLTLLQLLSFMDRGNIGNAKLQGLTAQLDLGGNRYSAALSLFFLPYCLLECPASLVTKKFRPSRWLPGLAILWGIIMTLMGLVQTYQQLVGVRVVLGAVEAGLFPGVAWYLSMWYPRHKLQYRVGIFWGGATIAGAFSGLLAFGISFMDGVGGKEGWSWIFIIEGLSTVFVGLFAALILVDFPDTAKFLSDEEKAYIIWRNKYDNSSVGEEERFAFQHVWAAVTDWQTWLHVVMNVSVIGPVYGISFFLPSIINGFGISSTAVSQLLTVPPYVFGTILTVLFAVYSDKLRIRFPFILLGQLLTIIGLTILLSDVSSGVRYLGTFFCIGGPYAAFPGVIAWLSNNMAGQYKRGTGLAVLIGFGNFSGSIAPLVFRQQDSPRYILGYAIEMMFSCLGIVALCIAVIIYPRANAMRARRQLALETEEIELSVEEVRAMGDRAPDFRYSL